MKPFLWATGGGFLARTLDEPFRPTSNLVKSVGWASLFATKTGQRILIGTAAFAVSKTASIAGSAAGATFGSTAVGVILGAGAGAVGGAAIGTAISSAIWGQQGKQTAIDFYTGVDTKWYDYIPHYSYGRIVKHYALEAIE